MNPSNDNFVDEFDKIVASLNDVKQNSNKIQKRYSTHLDVIVSVLTLFAGFVLLVSAAYLQNMFLGLFAFGIILIGGLKSWKTFRESSSLERIIVKYKHIQEYLDERDRILFGIRPQGERKRPEDEFWSF